MLLEDLNSKFKLPMLRFVFSVGTFFKAALHSLIGLFFNVLKIPMVNRLNIKTFCALKPHCIARPNLIKTDPYVYFSRINVFGQNLRPPKLLLFSTFLDVF